MVRFESEKGPENKTPIPGALDVVKLDGRWGTGSGKRRKLRGDFFG